MRRNDLGWALAGGLLLVLTATPGCSAKLAPGDQPARTLDLELRISVNRLVGIVPMELEISGTLLNEGKEEITPAEDHRVRLQVETTHYRIIGGARSQPFQTAGIDQIDSGGVPDPLVRNLLIRRPGTYHFQLILEDLEGNQVRSNPVEVRAM